MMISRETGFMLHPLRQHIHPKELLQLFLRKDVFEGTKFPELSKAVKYFKETERGFGEMCKTVEDYAKNYAKDYAEEREEIVREEERKNAEKREKTAREEERKNAIRKMLGSGLSREMILSMNYSEKELKAVEKELS